MTKKEFNALFTKRQREDWDIDNLWQEVTEAHKQNDDDLIKTWIKALVELDDDSELYFKTFITLRNHFYYEWYNQSLQKML